jgi:hypothetical protein
MVKTRSQTGNITLKKEEEEEEDCKPTLLLNGVNSTRSNNKITKRRPSKNKNRTSPALQVKVEENNDIKLPLKLSSNHSNMEKDNTYYKNK